MTKYYLYIVNNLKSILLASSNSKTELREMALNKIGEKIKKYDGLYLYRVKISKVPKKDIKKDNDPNNKIKTIGGPYVAIIQKIQINLNKDDTDSKAKLKNIDDQTNKIYFSKKYLTTNNTDEPLEKSITKMIWDFVQNKFNTNLFAINTVDK